MRAVIPDGERSRLVAKLIEQEVQQREKLFYESALQLEGNQDLNLEMQSLEKELKDDGLRRILCL